MKPSKLTKAMCDKIVEKNKHFYKTEHTYGKYKLHIYNYRLSVYDSFVNPLGDNSINALNMRGITFVENTHLNGSFYHRHYMLHKFFNLNENKDYLFDDLKNKEVDAIYNKLDGSLIQFILLPSNELIAKTQNSIISDQALAANNILYKDKVFKNELLKIQKEGYFLFFEYTAPNNRIVLFYDKPELRLIAVRNKDGEYIDFHKDQRFRYFNKTVKYKNVSLTDIYNHQKIMTDKEGFVVRFKDGTMVKLKTDWYFNAHKIKSSLESNLSVFQMVLNETIDDALSCVDDGLREFVNTKINKVIDYVSSSIIECEKQLKEKKSLSRKEFALKNKKSKFFPVIIRSYNNDFDLYKELKYFLLEKYNKEEKVTNEVFR